MWTRRRFIQAALASGAGLVVSPFGGCAQTPSVGAIREALASLRSQRVMLPPLDGYREFRGCVHAHTNLSHDSPGTPEEILEAARLARLDFLVTTDHYTPRIFTEGMEGRHGSVLVVRGLEVGLGCTRGGTITRRCASVLAIGLRAPLAPGADGQWNWDRLFQDIRAQGALSIIAHPRGLANAMYFEQADGMELYDLADILRERVLDIPRVLPDFALQGADFQEEVLLPLIVERLGWHLAEWDRHTKTRRFLGLAGNDAHQNLRIFERQVDPYALTLKVVNTHVLAQTESEKRPSSAAPDLTSERLVVALRAGRSFTAFTLLADAEGFRFAAHMDDAGAAGNDRTMVAVMGDEIPFQAGLVLMAHCPIPGILELLRDGVPIRRQEGRELHHRVYRPGVYRVEVSLRVMGRLRPWIFANPIYVRA